MSNRKRYYSLPDYKSVTQDIDTYRKAWQDLAKPLERELGLTLVGFDPTMGFRRVDPVSGQHVNLELPVWFVRELSNKLNNKQPTQFP